MKHPEKECGKNSTLLFQDRGELRPQAEDELQARVHTPEKLEHVVHVLGKYLPGKRPRWLLDPDILDMRGQSFGTSGLLLRSPRGVS